MSVSFHNHNHENNNNKINPPPLAIASSAAGTPVSSVYEEDDYFPKESTAIVPFKWEAVPGTPLHHLTHRQQNRPTSCKRKSTSDVRARLDIATAAPSSSMSSWDDDEEEDQLSDSDEDSREIISNSENSEDSSIHSSSNDELEYDGHADSDQFEHKMQQGRSTNNYTKPPNNNNNYCSPSIYPLRPPPKLIIPQHNNNNNLRVKDIINNNNNRNSSESEYSDCFMTNYNYNYNSSSRDIMNSSMSAGRGGGRGHHDADILLQERSRSFSLRASAAQINNMNSIVKRGIGAACRSFRFIHNNYNYAAPPAPKHDKSDVSTWNEAKMRLRDLMEHSANFSTAAAAASFNNYMHPHHQILHEQAEETHNINQYIIAAAADEADDEGAESLAHSNYSTREQEQHQFNIHCNSFSGAAISEIQESAAAHVDHLQYNYISSPKKVRSLSCCCWRP